MILKIDLSYVKYISLLSLSFAFFLMAFDHSYRIYSYAALGVFVAITSIFFLYVKNVGGSDILPLRMKLVGAVVTLLVLIQLVVVIFSDSELSFFDLFRILYSAPVLWAIFISIGLWGKAWCSNIISLSIFFLSVLALMLYFLGIHLDSMNFYAGLLLIPTMYSLLVGRYKIFLVLLIYIVSLGVFFEARGAYMAILVFLSIFLMHCLVRISPFFMIAMVLSVLATQFFLLHENSVVADEILTYRPSIWKYYYLESMDNFWFGSGPILTEVSEGAAGFYQYMVGRGVGLSYGTQSMYMLYFYESGFVGLILLLIAFGVVFLTNSKFTIPVLTISVLAMLETVKIGAVSVYGLPLTYFIALSLAEERA